MVLVVEINLGIGETSLERSLNSSCWRGLSEFTFVPEFEPTSFGLGWREHPERGLPVPSVMEQLDVVEDGGGELDPRFSLLRTGKPTAVFRSARDRCLCSPPTTRGSQRAISNILSHS